MKTNARFITIEGIDGVGKSTAIKVIADYLRDVAGHDVLTTREPGGTVVGEAIRDILIAHQEEGITVETESLLFFASRAQHLAKKILPALDKGTWVVCDRFTDASYAYQCGGSGVDTERLAVLETWVQKDFRPHLTLLLDAPLAVCRTRSNDRGEADRIEATQDAFFERVRQAYLARATLYPQQYCVIDASGDEDSVATQIQTKLATFCSE